MNRKIIAFVLGLTLICNSFMCVYATNVNDLSDPSLHNQSDEKIEFAKYVLLKNYVTKHLELSHTYKIMLDYDKNQVVDMFDLIYLKKQILKQQQNVVTEVSEVTVTEQIVSRTYMSDTAYNPGTVTLSTEISETTSSNIATIESIISSINDTKSTLETTQNNETENITSKPMKSYHDIDVKNIYQEPELMTGCEVTSLTMLFNYYGVHADKVDLAMNYMPRLDFYTKNGVDYGADFYEVFAGNPQNPTGYGCYAPCIVETAQKYIKDKNLSFDVVNLTGSDFEEILKYIDDDIPVVIWTTNYLADPYNSESWITPKGKVVTWLANEHCVLLTGYDMADKKVTVKDPLYGEMTYDINKFKKIYTRLGSNAVTMKLKKKISETSIENAVTTQVPSSNTEITVSPITTPPTTTEKTKTISPSETVEENKKLKVGDKVKYTGVVYSTSYGTGNSVRINGTYTISIIVADMSRKYRVCLNNIGWVSYNDVVKIN